VFWVTALRRKGDGPIEDFAGLHQDYVAARCIVQSAIEIAAGCYQDLFARRWCV
jgi:hypothetical protein